LLWERVGPLHAFSLIVGNAYQRARTRSIEKQIGLLQ
jgi:hypothetical protein